MVSLSISKKQKGEAVASPHLSFYLRDCGDGSVRFARRCPFGGPPHSTAAAALQIVCALVQSFCLSDFGITPSAAPRNLARRSLLHEGRFYSRADITAMRAAEHVLLVARQAAVREPWTGSWREQATRGPARGIGAQCESPSKARHSLSRFKECLQGGRAAAVSWRTERRSRSPSGSSCPTDAAYSGTRHER